MKLVFFIIKNETLMTHFQTPSFAQKAIACFEKIEKKSGGKNILKLYVNEGSPGKLINI